MLLRSHKIVSNVKCALVKKCDAKHSGHPSKAHVADVDVLLTVVWFRHVWDQQENRAKAQTWYLK